MGLIDQLWSFTPQYKKVQERFNVAETAFLSRREDQVAKAVFTEANAVHDASWNVIREFERKMFATEARTLAGVKAKARWYVQFYCQGDLDQIDGSFDNVISLFRELVAGEPSAPVGSGLAGGNSCVAHSPDPILGAIQAHIAAYADFSAAVDIECTLECTLPHERRLSSLTVWEEKIVETDDPRWPKAILARGRASDAADAAAMALLDIEPTTVAGAAALLKYVAEEEDLTFPDNLADDDGNDLSFGSAIAGHVAGALSGMGLSA